MSARGEVSEACGESDLCKKCKLSGHSDERSKLCSMRKTAPNRMVKDKQETEKEKLFHQTWLQVNEGKPQILSQKEAAEKLNLNHSAKEHLYSMMGKLKARMEPHSLGANGFSEVDLFLKVLGQAKNELFYWMENRMKEEERIPVQRWEFYSFLGMLIFLCVVRVRKENAFAFFGSGLSNAAKSHILSLSRFNELQHYLSGFLHKASTTDESHEHVTNKSSRFEDLDSALSKFVQDIVLDKFCRLSIDDRTIGRMSASEPSNTYGPRKGHKNGAGSDCCADATFRISVSTSLYDSDYNQTSSLNGILDSIQKNMHGDVQGVEVILGRAYRKPALYRACAQRGFSLTVINDKSQLQGNPFMASSIVQHENLDLKQSFVVDDGPIHGTKIFHAKKALSQNSQCTVSAHAYAVREFGDSKRSRIHRFVVLGPELITESLGNTYVMETFPKVRKCVEMNWLFYPEFDTDMEMTNDFSYDEENSSDDVYGEYNNEHDAGNDESYGNEIDVADVEGGNSEDSDEENFESQEQEDDMDDSWRDEKEDGLAHSLSSVSNMVSLENEGETFNKEDAEEESRSLVGPSLYGIECPDRQDVECILKEHIRPLTAGQRCADWFTFRAFMVTGNSAQDIAARSSVARRIMHRNPEIGNTSPLKMTEVASMLFDSWFHVPKSTCNSSNRDLITGSKNESAVVVELKSKPFVDAVFEIGLVQSKRNKALGVSADNVIIIHPPDESIDPINRILAPLEIKSNCTKRQIQKPMEVAMKYGKYFSCTAGSELWFEAVPEEYRGKLIHQAVVFNSCKTVFVVSTVGCIMYTVLVTFPSSVLRNWENLFVPIEKQLIGWAWNLLEEGHGDISMGRIPSSFSEEQRKVIRSRFPLWYALHLKRKSSPSSVLRPIRVLRSLVQFFYSKRKQGVGACDEYAQHFETRSLSLDWEKQVTLSKIIDAVVNTGLLWRMFKVFDNPSKPWKTLADFRHMCNRFISMSDFGMDLAQKLVEYATTLQLSHQPSPQSTTEESNLEPEPRSICREKISLAEHKLLMLKDNARKVISGANSVSVKRLRLSGNHHSHVPLSKKRTCVVCKALCGKICKFCNVPLHFTMRYTTNQSRTCWDYWHNEQNVYENCLEVTKPLKKKKKMSEEIAQEQ